MREILFRGKAIDGNWYFGVPIVLTEDYVCITAPHTYYKAVKPETVGQFTGLYDSTKREDLSTEEQAEFLFPTNGGKRKKEDWKGKPIFEGDIIKGSWKTILTIFYDEISSSYRVKTSTGYEREPSYYGIDKWKVIGNIHDNPELLGGGEE